MDTTHVPQFHCDVDPEDYISAQKTEGNTVLITVSHLATIRLHADDIYSNYGIELDRTNLINLIAHLQSIVPLLDS